MQEEDMDHDGILTEDAFLKVVKFLSIPFNKFMNLIKYRYDEFSNGKINIISLLYDMYIIRQNWQTTIGEFPDFPRKPQAERDQTLVFFCDVLTSKGILGETFTTELVQMGKSNKIKTSLILLEVIKVMWQLITAKKDPSPEARSPLLRVMDVVECLDPQRKGTIMDYQLTSILNVHLNMELSQFMTLLVTKLEGQKLDFRSYISSIISPGDIVSVDKLRSYLIREKFNQNGVAKMFKRLGLDNVNEIPFVKLQFKMEREMILTQVCERPDIVKQYIYGEAAKSVQSTIELGVDKIINQIHEGIKATGRDFNTVFAYPKFQIVSRDQFSAHLLRLGVTEYLERDVLLAKCKDRKDPASINLGALKSIYDSKYGLGSNATTAKMLESTIQKLRERVQNMGFTLPSLFAKADINKTESLDRAEIFWLLTKLDEDIQKEEANMIFDKIDRDRSGLISQGEFESFLKIESNSIGGNIRIDKVKWAGNIFSEINLRLEEKG